MKPTQYILLSLFALSLTGCVSFTPGVQIDLPRQQNEQTRNVAVMVNDVQITDSIINEQTRKHLASQLTGQLSKELERKGYFSKSISYPATLRDQDVQLNLTLTSLKTKRTTHPAYFPGAILTLTIWIWANGPIYVDKYDLAGELNITDAKGKVLASSHSLLKENQNTGFWSPDYFNLSLGSKQLNQLVDKLVQDSIKQLP